MKFRKIALAAVVSASLLSGCGGGGGDGGGVLGEGGGAGNVPATSAAYIVVAWNDLGMHCLNPSYDTAVILPPYNTVWAQVLKRGNPPQVVTSGVTVSYRILNNTTSQGKDSFTSSGPMCRLCSVHPRHWTKDSILMTRPSATA